MQKIFVYISSLFFCMMTLTVVAQTPKKEPKIDNTPFFNGLYINADVASVVSSLLSNGETYSYEASVQVDLKHKLYPVFELGYGGANKISNDNIQFKGNGMFGRFGFDINVIKPKKNQKPSSNLFLVGLRLGMANFNYSLSNINITDDYWGGTYPVNYSDLKPVTKLWFEIVGGVKVEVINNVFMGWTLRLKNLISQDVSGSPTPWYIPGFGTNSGTSLGLNYTIGYKFQIPTKNKKLETLKVPVTDMIKKATK